MKAKQFLKDYFYQILSGISTISLISTSFYLLNISKSLKEINTNILPISIWAKTQNDCITKTYRIDGKNTQGLPSKVWSCNGGGN